MAKADPKKVVFASPGFGATQHLAAEQFKQIAGVDMLHVPFRTSPEAIHGRCSASRSTCCSTPCWRCSGSFSPASSRRLAVTGKDRFPIVPDVPAATRVPACCRATT